ncbi:MAG TPA: LysE family translocator [Steroidobacteraceae bacterium]|jgi:threonine/homoserine/homoserine lactone efflux protein
MMHLHTYLLFVLAAVALILVPGPDMMYMLGRCLAQGRRAGILSAVGFNLGGYVHLTAAVLGLSAILATSATAFTVVKWAGAAYLIYLGVSALWSKQGLAIDTDAAVAGRRSRTILWQAFLSDVLNPKVALFFLALLPQFVDRTAAHPTLQIILLGVTVNAIGLPTNIAIACCAARVSHGLRRGGSLTVWLRRGLGVLFIGLGLRIAVERV